MTDYALSEKESEEICTKAMINCIFISMFHFPSLHCQRHTIDET